MTNLELPLTFVNDTNLINQTVEALKQKLDHISANEVDIWNAVHTHLKFNVSTKLSDSEYDVITQTIDTHIKDNIL